MSSRRLDRLLGRRRRQRRTSRPADLPGSVFARRLGPSSRSAASPRHALRSSRFVPFRRWNEIVKSTALPGRATCSFSRERVSSRRRRSSWFPASSIERRADGVAVFLSGLTSSSERPPPVTDVALLLNVRGERAHRRDGLAGWRPPSVRGSASDPDGVSKMGPGQIHRQGWAISPPERRLLCDGRVTNT